MGWQDGGDSQIAGDNTLGAQAVVNRLKVLQQNCFGDPLVDHQRGGIWESQHWLQIGGADTDPEIISETLSEREDGGHAVAEIYQTYAET